MFNKKQLKFIIFVFNMHGICGTRRKIKNWIKGIGSQSTKTKDNNTFLSDNEPSELFNKDAQNRENPESQHIYQNNTPSQELFRVKMRKPIPENVLENNKKPKKSNTVLSMVYRRPLSSNDSVKVFYPEFYKNRHSSYINKNHNLFIEEENLSEKSNDFVSNCFDSNKKLSGKKYLDFKEYKGTILMDFEKNYSLLEIIKIYLRIYTSDLTIDYDEKKLITQALVVLKKRFSFVNITDISIFNVYFDGNKDTFCIIFGFRLDISIVKKETIEKQAKCMKYLFRYERFNDTHILLSRLNFTTTTNQDKDIELKIFVPEFLDRKLEKDKNFVISFKVSSLENLSFKKWLFERFLYFDSYEDENFELYINLLKLNCRFQNEITTSV